MYPIPLNQISFPVSILLDFKLRTRSTCLIKMRANKHFKFQYLISSLHLRSASYNNACLLLIFSTVLYLWSFLLIKNFYSFNNKIHFVIRNRCKLCHSLPSHLLIICLLTETFFHYKAKKHRFLVDITFAQYRSLMLFW